MRSGVSITLRCPQCNIPLSCEGTLIASDQPGMETYTIDTTPVMEHVRDNHDPRIELMAEALRTTRGLTVPQPDTVARVVLKALRDAGALTEADPS